MGQPVPPSGSAHGAGVFGEANELRAVRGYCDTHFKNQKLLW